MILHQPAGDILSGYRLLEKAYKEGKLKAIGISNFNIDEIKTILNNCEIKPALIQVEAHPYYPQDELNDFLKKENIVLQSWFPLGGRGNHSILEEPIIKQLAIKYHKSPAQIVLRWHTQKNYVVIPGSKTKSHIIDNINIFDFTLTNEEMILIKSLAKDKPFYVRDEQALKYYETWHPDVEGQK